MRPGISIILSPADRRRLEALVGDRNVAQKHVWRARIVLHSADGVGTNGIMRRTGKSKTCVWRWQERFAQEATQAADRRRLEALVGDRNVAQKHVWRARIVLHSADGIGTNGIMRRTGKSKTCVWRWQERFAQEGYDGLLRDKTRPSRIPPLGPEVAERVVALTLSDPPAEATHWVAAMMAKATGISVSSVQRIWRAHGLRPHRVRQFKLSNDPDFVAKLRDVVGLYVDPPAHAIVLSVDEKSQIQALDRTQPGLPMKKGRLGTMTHDYKRHGTTTLFAALNVLEGKVIGRCMQRHRHRHQEFIRFLNAIEADIPAGKGVHVILDNYAAHKHAKVRAWLGRHERFTFHFVPTSCSWLNAVEGFFAKLSKRCLKRGVFRSIVDLQVAINRFLDETNDNPKPFLRQGIMIDPSNPRNWGNDRPDHQDVGN